MVSRPVFVNYKKAALDSQPQMLINCVLYEVCVYAGDACITVDLHQSDKRNVLLGPERVFSALFRPLSVVLDITG
jgi:hypothetical protein